MPCFLPSPLTAALGFGDPGPLEAHASPSCVIEVLGAALGGAARRAQRRQAALEARPVEFGRFAVAVAALSAGPSLDHLERANHTAFLLPQWERRGGRWFPRPRIGTAACTRTATRRSGGCAPSHPTGRFPPPLTAPSKRKARARRRIYTRVRATWGALRRSTHPAINPEFGGRTHPRGADVLPVRGRPLAGGLSRSGCGRAGAREVRSTPEGREPFASDSPPPDPPAGGGGGGRGRLGGASFAAADRQPEREEHEAEAAQHRCVAARGRQAGAARPGA